jgi:hypothetical protein
MHDSTRLQATSRWVRAMNRTERWHWFWGSLFPSPAYMRWRYSISAQWQLPLFYLYRWGVIVGDALQTMLKWLRHRLSFR